MNSTGTRGRRLTGRIWKRAGGFLAVALLLGTLGAAVPAAIPSASAALTEPANANPSELTWGPTTVGTTGTAEQVTLSLTPTTGAGNTLDNPSYTISGPNANSFNVTDDGCAGFTLVVVLGISNSCTDTVTFTPTTTGTNTATLTFTGDGGSTNVPLSGSGLGPAQLSISPGPVFGFGPVVDGNTALQAFTVTNTGGSTGTAGFPVLSGTDYSLLSTNCDGASLTAGASCTVTVQFAPTAPQDYTGSLTIALENSNQPAATVALDGQGVAPALPSVTASPTTLDFGNVVLGQNASEMITLTNNADTSQTVTGDSIVSSPDSGDFAVDGGTCATNPTIPPASDNTCTFELTFTPSQDGPETADFTVDVDGGAQTITVPLDGAGITPAVITTPGPVGFSPLSVGSISLPAQIGVYNPGPQSENLGQATLTDATDFTLESDGCSNQTLAPGAGCLIDVSFTPQSVGNLTSSLSLPLQGVNQPLSLTLEGTGVADTFTLTATNGNADFGTVADGTTSAPTIFTVTNTSSAAETYGVSSLFGPNAGDFHVISDDCSGVSVPAGQSCEVSVDFAPSIQGSESAEFVVTDGTNGTTAAQLLTGTGAPGSTLSWTTSLTFPNTQLGQSSASQPVDVTNTGANPVTFGPAPDYSLTDPTDFSVVGDTCSGNTLAPNDSCQFDVVFDPATSSQVGPLSSVLTFANNAGGSPQAVDLQGTSVAAPAGGGLTLSAPYLDFGAQPEGIASGEMPLVVTNDGNSSIIIGTDTIMGNQAGDFSNYPDECSGTTVQPNQSCTIEVTFTPSMLGPESAALEIPYDGVTGTLTVPLFGTGVDASSFSVAPNPENLGSAVLGSSSGVQDVVVTNTGSTALNFAAGSYAISGPDASYFHVIADGCSGQTVAPGDTCEYGVVFEPTATATTGAMSANFAVTAAGLSGAPQSLVLEGTAVAAPASLGLVVSPLSIGFNDVGLGIHSPDTQVTVTNDGSAAVRVNSDSIMGSQSSEFRIDTDHCAGVTLAANQSCTTEVYFAPKAIGVFSATLVYSYGTAGGTLTVPLGGTGVAATTDTVSPNPVNFGTVGQGAPSQPVQITVTNTGSNQLLFDFAPGILPPIVGVNAGDFSIVGDSCLPFLPGVDPGATCTIDLVFTPSSIGAESAQLYLLSNAAGSPQTINLEGFSTAVPATYSVSPTSWNAGNESLNPTSGQPTQTFTVTNTSAGTQLLQFNGSDATIVGPNASEFTLVPGTDTCAGSLVDPPAASSNDSCQLQVEFSPTVTGPANATLEITPVNGLVTQIPLSGNGVAAGSVSVSTNSLAFGNQQQSTTSSELWAVVTNSSPNSSLVIGTTPVVGTNASDFTVANNYCAGVTLQVAQSCKIGVTFTPSTTSSESANLQIFDNAADSPQLIALTGTGTAAVSLLAAPLVQIQGYWLVGSDGGVFAFGAAGYYGSTAELHLNAPIVGMAATPDGGGYWLVGSDGGIFTFGDAHFYGSMGNQHLDAPIVGIAATPDGGGYWLVAADGGIFSFGDAHFYGSMGGKPLNQPIVGMAPTADGGGYWLVASDGGIFAFGDALFYGSEGGKPLNQPIVGMVPSADGGGYLLTASDGGVFAFGDANFYGSAANIRLKAPIIGITPTPDGGGYWQSASDGGVFSYGDAVFQGSLGDLTLNRPIVGMAGDPV